MVKFPRFFKSGTLRKFYLKKRYFAITLKKYSPVHRRVLEGVLEEIKERFFGPSTPWNFFFGIFLYWVVCTVEFKEQPYQR